MGCRPLGQEKGTNKSLCPLLPFLFLPLLPLPFGPCPQGPQGRGQNNRQKAEEGAGRREGRLEAGEAWDRQKAKDGNDKDYCSYK